MGSFAIMLQRNQLQFFNGGFGVSLVLMVEIRFVCNTKNIETLHFPFDPILASLSKQQQSFCLAKKKVLLRAG
jgi:hypothetical protein